MATRPPVDIRNIGVRSITGGIGGLRHGSRRISRAGALGAWQYGRLTGGPASKGVARSDAETNAKTEKRFIAGKLTHRAKFTRIKRVAIA